VIHQQRHLGVLSLVVSFVSIIKRSHDDDDDDDDVEVQQRSMHTKSAKTTTTM